MINFNLKANKIKGIIFVLFFALVLFLLFRGSLLRLYFNHKVVQFESRYSMVVDYKNLKFSGLAGVKLENLKIYPKDASSDTLLIVDSIFTRMSFIKLFLFKPDLKELNIGKIRANFIKRDSISNYDFLFKGSSTNDSVYKSDEKITYNFSKITDKFLHFVLAILPAEAKINDINICYTNGIYKLNIAIPYFLIEANEYNTKIITQENGNLAELSASGVLSDRERKISAKVQTPNGENFVVPFLGYRWGADLRFKKLEVEFTSSQRKSDLVILQGKTTVEGISVFHKKLSPENVILDKGEFIYKTIVGKNYIELDSSSTTLVNGLMVSPYIRAEKNEKWHITASLNKPNFSANQLFSSLPKGLFYNLEGLKTSGNLDFHFLLDIDFNSIDSLKLESKLIPHNFKILSFGNTDFRYINSSFDYTAYENGVPLRTFTVGPENHNFRTLDKISPNLQLAVLQSEDGGFFYHNGFLIESIKEALALDIKDKRFRRGGSTISMQLAKNLFLSRNKTLARKFEEIMIVWLMETNRLSSKERMFEIYLNIIEWGPMVYGANEAARFYFDKDAKDLTINESIFLASIIPSPKRALNSFTSDYKLKPELEGYFRLLAQRFRVKGLINEAEESAIKPEINISASLKSRIDTLFLKRRDTVSYNNVLFKNN